MEKEKKIYHFKEIVQDSDDIKYRLLKNEAIEFKELIFESYIIDNYLSASCFMIDFTHFLIPEPIYNLLEQLFKKYDIENKFLELLQIGIIFQHIYSESFELHKIEKKYYLNQYFNSVNRDMKEFKAYLNESNESSITNLKANFKFGNKTYSIENPFINKLIFDELDKYFTDEYIAKFENKINYSIRYNSIKEEMYKVIDEKINLLKTKNTFIAKFCSILQIPIKDGDASNCQINFEILRISSFYTPSFQRNINRALKR